MLSTFVKDATFASKFNQTIFSSFVQLYHFGVVKNFEIAALNMTVVSLMLIIGGFMLQFSINLLIKLIWARTLLMILILLNLNLTRICFIIHVKIIAKPINIFLFLLLHWIIHVLL